MSFSILGIKKGLSLDQYSMAVFLWASAFSLFLFMNRVVGRKERRVWLVDCQN